MQARCLNLNKAHHIVGTELRQFRWPVAEAIFEEAADERKIVDLRRLGQRAIFTQVSLESLCALLTGSWLTFGCLLLRYKSGTAEKRDQLP